MMSDKKQCFRKEMKKGFHTMEMIFKFILSFLVLSFPMLIMLIIIGIFPSIIIVDNPIPVLIFIIIGGCISIFYIICIGTPIMTCYIIPLKTLFETSLFENEIFCPKCGRKTDGNGSYCAWCGSNIMKEMLEIKKCN